MTLSRHVWVWMKMSHLNFIYSNNGGLEGRMRLQVSPVPWKEIASNPFGQCLLTFMLSCLVCAWLSVARLLSHPHRQTTQIVCQRETFFLAWPAQNGHFQTMGGTEEVSYDLLCLELVQYQDHTCIIWLRSEGSLTHTLVKGN